MLDSDPAIRWQTLRDLTIASTDVINAERSKVGIEGMGAQLLNMQAENGTWGNAAWNRGWDSTMHVLMLLRDMGLDPAGEPAITTLARVRENVTWQGDDAYSGNPFFSGEVEPCINGQVGAVGAYFKQDVSNIINRLLTEQLPDGGWNCEAENGSTRGSFNTTICVLEALSEYEIAFGSRSDITQARHRGEEYLLARRLYKRLSTGEVIYIDRKDGTGNHEHPAFTQLAFPTWWHYDILRGLDYFRRTGQAPDDRLSDAINLLKSKRHADGTWHLDRRYEGRMPVELDEGVGKPNKWITLQAMRVLKWYEGASSL
ncbi:MAG: hypothetical protein AAFN11_20655 [Chloroflexota bacterium]